MINLPLTPPPRLPSGKKGQGLSLNTIIIGLIVLVVLVVIIAIFTASSGRLAENAGSCEAAGGKCYKNDDPADGQECGTKPFAKKTGEYTTPLDVYCEYDDPDTPVVEKDQGVCCPKVINW